MLRNLFSYSYIFRTGDYGVRIQGENLLPAFLAAPFDEPEFFGDDVFDIEQGIAVLESTCEFRVRVDATV